MNTQALHPQRVVYWYIGAQFCLFCLLPVLTTTVLGLEEEETASASTVSYEKQALLGREN